MSEPEQPPDWCQESYRVDIERARFWDSSRIREIRSKQEEAGHIRPLPPEEVIENIQQFVIARVDQSVEWCIRIFPTAYPRTLELGSFLITPKYQWNGLSKRLLQYAEEFARDVDSILISVTNNPLLESKYLQRGWVYDASGVYLERSAQSPMKKLLIKYPE